MLDFTNLQTNAKKLPENLIRAQSNSYGCLRFFPLFKSQPSELQDAKLLAKLANTLHDTNDNLLAGYLKKYDLDCETNPDQLLEFKAQTLMGMYLLVWSRHHSRFFSPNALVCQLQLDILVTHPTEISKAALDSYLCDLSRYCAFVLEQKNTCNEYLALCEDFGPGMQPEIETLKNAGFARGTYEYSQYLGNICTMDSSKMS